MNLLSLWNAVSLYWNTIKYLRPVQFYGRVWFRIYRPKPDIRPAPERSIISGDWQRPAVYRPSLTGPRSFLLLNKEGNLDDINWNGPQRDTLWRYNQHYFDDLNAQDSLTRSKWHAALVDDWITKNPPGKGIGWEPYPVSMRVVNWIKWALGGAVFSARANHSLAVQIRWLSRRIENYLLGNHLFINAKALIMSGLFFNGPEADSWIELGMRIIKREMIEQILTDGGHFERSPMYHSLIFLDILDLINMSRTFSSRLNNSQKIEIESWVIQAQKMYSWLIAMCHPDLEISFFNDSAFGVAPSIFELTQYAERLSIIRMPQHDGKIIHLTESGYIRINHSHAVAILDVATIGPDYLPAHAHADTLSFELSLDKQRILVNSGISQYGNDAERVRQRGTAAHNTVEVSQESSSEVWSGFRVARRAYPIDLAIEKNANNSEFQISCGHNGYSRLPGRPIHQRSWKISHGCIRIIDIIKGSNHIARARYHFHPDLRVVMFPNQKEGQIHSANGRIMDWRLEKGYATLEKSVWHPEFGRSEPNLCLSIDLIENGSEICFLWDD